MWGSMAHTGVWVLGTNFHVTDVRVQLLDFDAPIVVFQY